MTPLDRQAFVEFADAELFVPPNSTISALEGGFVLSMPRSLNDFELDYYLAAWSGSTFSTNPIERSRGERLLSRSEGATAREQRLAARVREYYAQVDRGDTPSIISMYAADGAYERAEDRYEGPSRIQYFHEHERRIIVTHTVESAVAKGDEVIVRGSYRGTNQRGDAIAGRFADFWRFNAADLVTLRQTYLAQGAASVRA